MGSISSMQIAPDQGAFMELLTRALGVTEALEVGTFTGYSAISIARGLAPAGRLICCEVSARSTRRPRPATSRRRALPIASRSVLGPAPETLRRHPRARAFDLAFIDANKTGYRVYFEEALATRPGGLILLDNVLQDGRVLDPAPDDESTRRSWRSTTKLVGDERVDLSMVGDRRRDHDRAQDDDAADRNSKAPARCSSRLRSLDRRCSARRRTVGSRRGRWRRSFRWRRPARSRTRSSTEDARRSPRPTTSSPPAYQRSGSRVGPSGCRRTTGVDAHA